MPVRLVMRTRYRVSMLDRVQYGPVPKQRLYERFTDGRISGLLNEDMLQTLFIGLTRNDIGGGSHDLMDQQNRRYEARTITNRGVNLIPSNQIGQGRTINLDAIAERRNELYAFIFVDVRNSPNYFIFSIPVDDPIFEYRRRLSCNQVDGVVSEYPNRTIRL